MSIFLRLSENRFLFDFLMIQCNNCTGHICVLPFVIRDSYTLSDWNLFWNQLKNKQLQTNNYNCQIKYFILLWAIFFCIKRLSCSSNSSPANAGNCTLESSILKTSWRNMLPGTTSPSPCTCITNGTSPPAEPLLSVLTILKVYFFLLVCRMKDLWCSYHFIKATWIISYSPLSLLQGT